MKHTDSGDFSIETVENTFIFENIPHKSLNQKLEDN